MFDKLREDEEFKAIINEVQGEHKRIREELSGAESMISRIQQNNKLE